MVRDHRMRTYSVYEARAAFSRLIARAIEGEPQRITRHGRPAVVIVSEADWIGLSDAAPRMVDLFLKHAGDEGYESVFGDDDPIATQDRPVGSDFASDEMDAGSRPGGADPKGS